MLIVLEQEIFQMSNIPHWQPHNEEFALLVGLLLYYHVVQFPVLLYYAIFIQSTKIDENCSLPHL